MLAWARILDAHEIQPRNARSGHYRASGITIAAGIRSSLRAMTLRPTVRDIAIVLAVSWVARAVFVAAIGDHHSLDVEFWRVALDAQDQGRNPYGQAA